MGAFYGSVQVRSEDRGAVKAVAESVARSLNSRCLVSPAINGWIGVYPSMNGQDERVGASIAAEIDADVLQLIVHDDDVFAYWLYRGKRLVDSFWSVPGYFSEENRREQDAMEGDAEQFRSIIGDQIDRLAALLTRGEEQELSATEQLDEFAKALKVSNALSAYEYLKDGETEEIKKWKQFEEVPADQIAAAKQTARQLRKEVETARKQLKAEGALLLHDERKGNERPFGCAVGHGFVVGWADHGPDTIEFRQYGPPWVEIKTPNIETSKHVTELASNAGHKRLAISAGDAVHVFDVSGDEWSRVIDIPETDLAMTVALSADGKLIAHASRERIAVTEIKNNRQICVVPRSDFKQIAFHPDGEWISVAKGWSVGLISVRSPHPWRDIYVGGKKEVASHSKLIAKKLETIDLEEMERLQRVEMEKMIKQLQRASGKGKQTAMSDADVQRFRESMEQSILEMRTRFKDLKEGRHLKARRNPRS